MRRCKRTIGGVCVHTGTIPSKTFREAVLHFSRIGGSRFFGPPEEGDRDCTARDRLARDAVPCQAGRARKLRPGCRRSPGDRRIT